MAWRIQHIGQVLSLAYLPIAMVCLPKDFERFDDFALKAGYSRAVRRAFTDLDAAVAWSTQKGKVWRARQIEARRQAHAA